MYPVSYLAADLRAWDDLINILKAIPGSRWRRGVQYPQQFLLLLVELVIHRG